MHRLFVFAVKLVDTVDLIEYDFDTSPWLVETKGGRPVTENPESNCNESSDLPS